MSTRWIEIDDEVWKYLQEHAQPFVDTPNSVLHKLLFDRKGPEISMEEPPISFKGMPVALAQILEVIYEIEKHGYSRPKATRLVAERRGTVVPTIMDKYCKQLGLKAKEVDELFDEPGYSEFKKVLKENFTTYKDVIDIYFETITIDHFAQMKDHNIDD
ncbi:MAG: hypothetical protein WBR24_16555 [Desulfobacterales bacterium]|jgi:hypothetical protein